MGNELQILKLSGLSKLDEGAFAEEVDQLLEICRQDCAARPNVDKARTVTIKVSMFPVPSSDGKVLEGARIVPEVKHTLPTRSTRAYQMSNTREGLAFSETAPENPQQGTF